MRKATQFFLDRLSIGVSVICALHCASFPLILAVFPSIAVLPVDDEVFHEMLVWLVLPSSVMAASIGCSRHKDLRVFLGIGLGLVIFVFTAFFGHDLLGETGEKGATFVAAIILAWSHWRNFSLCRKESCNHSIAKNAFDAPELSVKNDCCSTDQKTWKKIFQKHKSVLWVVLYLNLGMFVVEAIYGWLASSNALWADSLDMLGDAIIYGVSLIVLNQETVWRNRAALLKGYLMAALAFSIMLFSFYRFYNPVMPGVEMMGIIGILAFTANVICLFLLTRHKNDDINMRSSWICARNDVLVNLSVLVAAGGVAWTGSHWPDLVISMLICSFILKSSLGIIREAQEELKPITLPIP